MNERTINGAIGNIADYSFPVWARLLHTGMAVFGIAAYLTAELAEHAESDSTGYLIHAYLGLSLMSVLTIRFMTGYGSHGVMGFKGWFPFSRSQFQPAVEDVGQLLQLKMPHRSAHQGITGVVQAAGLLIFMWMAITGTGIYLLGGAESGFGEILEELHEVGEGLVPLYLLLHVGSVFLHSMAGTPVWQKMWKFGK
jgi:cytochrome b561